MKVVHILVGRARPETPDGVSHAVYYLAKYQELRGADVRVLSLSKKTEYEGQLFSHDPAVELFSVTRTRIPLNTRLIKRIEEIRPNIVHFHSVFIPEYCAIAPKLRSLGIPYVVTPHAGYRTEAMKRHALLKRLWFYTLDKYFLNKAHAIHFLTESERTEFQTLQSPNHVKQLVAPNGVEIAEPNLDRAIVRREIMGRFNLPSNAITFLFVGRLDIGVKGLDLLLEAFTILLRNNPIRQIHLILAGPEVRGSFSKLRNITRTTGIDCNVHMPGPIFGEDKQRLILATDFFVLPSRSEGVPCALLEALSLGAKCIVSDQTGVSEDILRYNAGWVVKPIVRDIALVLNKAIQTLTQQTETASIDTNISRLLTKYNWNTVAQKVLSSYPQHC